MVSQSMQFGGVIASPNKFAGPGVHLLIHVYALQGLLGLASIQACYFIPVFPMDLYVVLACIGQWEVLGTW